MDKTLTAVVAAKGDTAAIPAVSQLPTDYIVLCILPHLVYKRNNLQPINVSLFTQAGIRPSPNTGVSACLSSGEVSEVSISVFTAVRASGCVNKKPNSQNAAGPTLPWKQTHHHDKVISLTTVSHGDGAGGY